MSPYNWIRLAKKKPKTKQREAESSDGEEPLKKSDTGLKPSIPFFTEPVRKSL
jgi:hypothetical protein